jgi:phospholipase C
MDNWLPAHRKADGKNGSYVMGYHTRADLPFQFALAETFTVCDSCHCSVFGPTAWAKTAFILNYDENDGLFDHTSVLQLLEKVTGVTEPNISQWRRKTFGDLTQEPGHRPRVPRGH